MNVCTIRQIRISLIPFNFHFIRIEFHTIQNNWKPIQMTVKSLWNWWTLNNKRTVLMCSISNFPNPITFQYVSVYCVNTKYFDLRWTHYIQATHNAYNTDKFIYSFSHLILNGIWDLLSASHTKYTASSDIRCLIFASTFNTHHSAFWNFDLS